MKTFSLNLIALTLLILFTACKVQSKISQKEKVKNTIIKMVNAIDTKQWDKAEKQFTKNVFVDYSSMTGQPGNKVKAAYLVNGWKKILETAKTHHILSNYEVEISGKTSRVYSHVYASHTHKKSKYWDIYGRYEHKLEKTKDGWKINSMKFIVYGQRGNTKFLSDIQK